MLVSKPIHVPAAIHGLLLLVSLAFPLLQLVAVVAQGERLAIRTTLALVVEVLGI
jgi:hypothetical protein